MLYFTDIIVLITNVTGVKLQLTHFFVCFLIVFYALHMNLGHTLLTIYVK